MQQSQHSQKNIPSLHQNMRHLITLKYVDAVARSGSIRKAAEKMSITSTALNRRVLAIEDDLGVQIFERLSKGVRLSAAGEILIKHIRAQLSDMERVQNQIADLDGERRGHIKIASSQVAMVELLPKLIAQYRQLHPAVTFEVLVCNRHNAEKVLTDFTADLAIVFEPERFVEFHSLLDITQQAKVVCSRDHQLADKTSVRFSQCFEFPMALPTVNNGLRNLLEKSVLKSGGHLNPVIESDNYEFLDQCLQDNQTISFQLPIGLTPSTGNPSKSSLIAIPINIRDVPAGKLFVGQLRGRTLPVAVAKFSEMLGEYLKAHFTGNNSNANGAGHTPNPR